MTTTHTEKRLQVRFPSNRPVLMIVNNKNIYAVMSDFSRHGIGFTAIEKPDIHSRIEVHFDIPNTDKNNPIKPFQFKAEVKHCINYGPESHIGVRLEMPSEEYLQLFDSLSVA